MPRRNPAEDRPTLALAETMLGGVVLLALTGRLGWLIAAGAYGLARWLWANGSAWRAPKRFGLANAITGVRIGLVFGLALCAPAYVVPWGGWMVLAIFGLDGLDG